MNLPKVQNPRAIGWGVILFGALVMMFLPVVTVVALLVGAAYLVQADEGKTKKKLMRRKKK